ncbi:polysaccharide biosynthesis tyrosine autokinase [Burkholderia stabilis]|uniref:Tyrosine-protein kinase in cps region,tyrosine kinase,Capsular polysaccharide biosynthesis protein,exopolysaccharide transport protein family,Chain length determinant protein n=1 Tax=Burkholderia stabilis TaxID=95485 RepID=A0AAJ5NCP4_9BURK|nr:polysaccharide biosynthesis tyrosine autokinase [Burkholderia stabilis]VBB15703.1 Putative tyrosine-protein kinase in cps region,tyrosine kinase,Capsular polysaccharide biosynthesis protein,exopolysaccharide transport protein family,Chain length determinant protein [Burkholderia stabilis]
MNVSNLNQTGVRDADELDVRGILDMLIRHAGRIAAVTAACTVLGAGYALVAKPVYRADIAVQVESGGSDLRSMTEGGLVGSLGGLFDVKSTDDGEMQILRSRLVTEPVVDSQNLHIEARPRRVPVIGPIVARFNRGVSTPGLLGIGGFVWGSERIDISVFDVPRELQEHTFIVTSAGDGRYRLSGAGLDREAEGVTGEPLRVKTAAGDVTLQVAGIEAEAGAQFVVKAESKQVALAALQKKLAIANRGKDQSGVIGVSYEGHDPVRAAAVLNAIADNYVRQNANRKAAAAEKSLAFLSDQLPTVERQLRAAEDRLNAYQARHEIVDLTEQAKAMVTQSATAQTTLFELEQKRLALASTLTPAHPELAAVDRQIAAARAQVGTVNDAIRRLPDTQRNVVRLRRDVTVQTDIYVGLLSSIQQLHLATASKVGNVRVIDRAIVPDEPVRPKPALVTAIAALVGLVLGTCGVIGRAMLFGGLTDPVEIERDTNLNVIATIPQCTVRRRLAQPDAAGRGASILALEQPDEPAVEALRSLCTALRFQLMDRPDANRVLITGPSEGVGKSFVSANVAALLGQANKRVLLIDGDLRRGELAKRFGIRPDIGLSTVLRRGVTAFDAIVRDAAPNVDLLPAGPRAERPVELLSSDRFAAWLAHVARDYDVVLLDAPPLLPVTDAVVLAEHADTILLVARSGETSAGELLESAKRIERVGARTTAVVFNGFRPGLRSAQYGNYGAYAYNGADPQTAEDRT